MGLWIGSLVASVIGIGTALLFGGSIAGFGFGIVGTLVAVVALFVNRRRQMNPDYDYSKPWFGRGIAFSYWVSVVASLLHIVRYAIAYAKS